ncbi:MAG: AzlC family ABC transporter permease [Oscillospiraceae bacterium]|nr:AzlC family ABC transporter permease [Oscillospiraceae bacterium]
MKHTLRAVFPLTIPVLTGYVFMGMAFGILLASKGFAPLWAVVMGVFIYAGSGQFVAVGLMSAGFDPLGAFLVTLMVNARHLFYGISMLERFKDYGKAKWYMIFALTDETFALCLSAKPPTGISEKRFYFTISLLDHIYWIIGCTLGGIIGSALPINTAGIDFVMTALFVVIFLDQWRLKQNRTPALIGLGASIICRIVFGPDLFILACMAALVIIFGVFRKPIERSVSQ